MTLKDFCSFFTIWAGMKIPFRAILHFVMFVDPHHNKVIRGVVGAIAVLMMYHFIWLQRSTQHLLGYNPMLIKLAFAALTNYPVSASGNVTTLPVPMIGSILASLAFCLAASNWRFTQLVKAGGAESGMTESLVFFRGHPMNGTKVSSRNLHRADKTAQLAFDGVFKCIFHTLIIPQHNNRYYVSI